MTTPPTLKAVEGSGLWDGRLRTGEQKRVKHRQGERRRVFPFLPIGNDISFFCHCETALTYVDGLPLLGDKVRNGLLLPCWVNRHGPLEVYRASQSSSLGLVG
ncbi:UNVERIFIED_CONTAM: hypothetical protein Sradi_7075100 [Sesamum radiatum]|uniref:Uncharacterized protein n=1 Tax=Sesamum radiatum TaxID=300843 RepID=A0AAW2J4Q7_SESRA